jgi:hypothetical protein
MTTSVALLVIRYAITALYSSTKQTQAPNSPLIIHTNNSNTARYFSSGQPLGLSSSPTLPGSKIFASESLLAKLV